MYDWEKNLPKVREKLKQENDERRRFEDEANKRLWPYDFIAGIVLFITLIVVVAVLQPPEPVCGDYTQITGTLRAEGYWVDSSGSPPSATLLYQLYKSTDGSEKIAIVDYRTERTTCVVNCVEGRCDNLRTWLETPGHTTPLTSTR